MESRRHPRYPVTLPVAFWGAASGEGRIVNLSAGGCGVESEVSPAPGQTLRLYTVLPASHTTVVIEVAPVRWAKGRRFGVEFVTLPPASQQLLTQWLARLEAGGT